MPRRCRWALGVREPLAFSDVLVVSRGRPTPTGRMYMRFSKGVHRCCCGLGPVSARFGVLCQNRSRRGGFGGADQRGVDPGQSVGVTWRVCVDLDCCRVHHPADDLPARHSRTSRDAAPAERPTSDRGRRVHVPHARDVPPLILEGGRLTRVLGRARAGDCRQVAVEELNLPRRRKDRRGEQSLDYQA